MFFFLNQRSTIFAIQFPGIAVTTRSGTLVSNRTNMISIEDCIALCGLDEEQVLAIAEHEHIPEIAAAALADYLLHKKRGPEMIREMIIDDIHVALKNQDLEHSHELLMALRHFLEQFPELESPNSLPKY